MIEIKSIQQAEPAEPPASILPPGVRIDWSRVFAPDRPPKEAARPSILGSLVFRRAIFARNGVSWISLRAWRVSTKDGDLEELKRQKAMPLPPFIPKAAAEIAESVGQMFGGISFTVTSIACGHSRRPDCAGAQLAQEAAARLGRPYQRCFDDRFQAGSSHPKAFKDLPALVLCRPLPTSPVLIVDDVATSGWHVEEALTALRTEGIGATAIAWISGTINASE
jgi:hypothetical protein